MPTVVPSLLKLIGDGFVGDAFAADGNHLRWMFEPRLGFPRTAFCLQRRPSVADKRGLTGVDVEFESFGLLAGQPPQTVSTIVRSGLRVAREVGSLRQEPNGIVLTAEALTIDFHAGSAGVTEPYACFVRLGFVIRGRSAITADALYLNRGEPEVVDRGTYRSGPILPDHPVRPDRVIAVTDLAKFDAFSRRLARPDIGTSRPKLTTPDEKRLYERVKSANPNLQYVRPTWVKALLKTIKDLDLDLVDLGEDLSLPIRIEIVLSADRIDRVGVTGRGAWLSTITFVRTEDLMKGKWEEIGCFPIATAEPEYAALNAGAFAGEAPDDLARSRVLDRTPCGAEPLDDPQVPPVRPPTDPELLARYLDTWRDRLEPWVHRVLADSGPTLHQSEVRLDGPLTDGGHLPGELPGSLSGLPTQVSIAPYSFVLQAASVFRTALLLGLAAVDDKGDNAIWDYRVRGSWRLDDILAWGVRLQREVERILDEMTSASPFEFLDLQERLLIITSEAAATVAFLDAARALAADDTLQLYGLVMGVRPTAHGLFAGPPSLSAGDDGLGTPPEGAGGALSEGIVALEWPLRARARVLVNETIPMGAAIRRDDEDAADPVLVLNPTAEPDGGPPVAVIPAGPLDDPGAAGDATFRDRRAANGTLYRYGVSECDPFGRWSAFTETLFRWVRLVPPRPPVDVVATLSPSGAALRLTVNFSWPQANAPDDHEFRVHVRRTAPPPEDPITRGTGTGWERAERLAGSGAGAYRLDGSGSGPASHDGMTTSVAIAADALAEGGPRRRYTVVLDGIVLDRDSMDRAIAFVGVSSIDASGLESDEVGGPARAEHVIADPPPVPSLPAEPLVATFADADDRSTITLRWSAAATRRYIVYRAGERELVRMATDVLGAAATYDPTRPIAERAQRLRELARSARPAFQPRSPRLEPGTASYVDDLQGHLRTLTIYTVLAESPGGVLSAWPNAAGAFAVIVVPEASPPARPAIARAAWRAPSDGGSPSPGGVELTIAEPPTATSVPAGTTAEVAAYEVYRTRTSDRATDARLMRPVGELVGPVFVEDTIIEDTPAPRRPRITRFIDTAVSPWTTYFYRVVARARRADAQPGMRSEPSAPVRVTTLDAALPAAPTDITHSLVGPDVEIRFRANAPANAVGPFRFEAARRDPSPLTLGRFVAEQVRDSAGPDTFRVTFPRAMLTPDGVTPAAVTFVVRIVDPIGQRAESVPVAYIGA